MKKKKLIALLLCMTLTAGILPGTGVRAAEASPTAMVEQLEETADETSAAVYEEYAVTEDAYIRSGGWAGNNYNYENITSAHGEQYVGKNYRVVNVKNYNGEIISAMKFDLPTAEEIAQSDKVEFVFNIFKNPNSNAGDQIFKFCYSTDTSWTETGINWNNKPADMLRGSENGLFDFEIKAGTEYEFMDDAEKEIHVDITEKVQALVEAGNTAITVYSYAENSNNTSLMIHERSSSLASAGSNSDKAMKIVVSNASGVALQKLNTLIAECEKVSADDYSKESFEAFAAKLSEAKAFTEGNPGDEAAVNEMYDGLKAAREALVAEKAYAVTADAFIRSDRGTNTGDSETLNSAHGAEYVGKNCRALNVKKYSGGADIMSVMKLPLPSKEEIEAGQFNEYEFVFNVIRNPGFDKGDQTYRFCYTTDTQWQENTITWNTKPATIARDSANVLFDFEVKQGTDYQTMIRNGETDGEVRFDITEKVSTLVAEGKSEVTIFAYGVTPVETSLQFHERSSLLASAGTNNADVAAKIVAKESAYTLEKLNALIAQCESLQADDYTADSFAALTAELNTAKEFALTEPTDAVQIRAAYKALEAAKDALVKTIDPNDADNIAYMRPTRSNLSNPDSYKVNDGKTDTYWQGKFYPAYVDVDLMDTYDISEIILNFPKDKAVYYTLYGSNDGKTYDEIYRNHSDEKKTAADIIALTDCSYRIVRVYIEYTDTNNASYLSEIKVHGTKTNTNTEELRTGTFEEITGIKDYSETEYAAPITEEETIENVYGIVERTAGVEYREWFEFDIAPAGDNGYDYFELSDTADGKVLITGNEGVSLAAGLNYYYKNYVNVQISEQSMQAKMPANIVPINGTVRKETPMKVRYAYNYCTLSYTYAFFGEEEWQKENDWLALNGVNVVLDLAGQEATWIKFLMDYNYSFDEAKDWLVGPGYYAWQFMDNMDQFGGPIPDGYVIDRVELARSTQRWKNSLGMGTVLQGYAGMVPNNFTEYNPDVQIIEQPQWGGFDRPDMIATDSELYDTMAEKFYETQQFIYGETSDYYAVDPFHEGGTRPSGLTDNTIAQEVLESLLKFDKDAVWVVQAWQSNPTNGLLDGMGENREEHCLIVDLIKYPIESNLMYKTSEFKGTSWAWCLLGNFGGNPTMNAQLETMVDLIQTAKKERQHMTGLGIISEAMYDNPMVYDLIFDLAWADESFSLNKWMDKYVERRYGGITDDAKTAWDLIESANYAQGVRATPGIFGLRPSYGVGGQPHNLGKINVGYDTANLENALRLLVKDFDKFKDSEAYRYDLTEIMRQVVSNYATMKHNEILDAKNAKDLEKFRTLKAELLNAFDVMNEVLGTQKDLLGGEWVGKAQDRAADYDDFSKSTFEMNAKSIITTWGNGYGGLIDYGYRTYEGMFTDLIKTNWETHLDKVEKNITDGTSISGFDYRQKYWKWVIGEQNYTRDAADSPEEVLAVANKVLEECVFAGELDPNIGNIALGKNVTTKGTASGKASFVTDGTADEVFTIKGTASEAVIDLIGVFDISKVQVLLDNTAEASYEVCTSVDGKVWEKAAAKTAGEETEIYEELGKIGRYVKVVNSGSTELKFKEVRVYGNGTLPSLEMLEDLIKTAEGLNTAGRPQEKINNFETALAVAKEALKNEINPDNLSNVYWDLYDAIVDMDLFNENNPENSAFDLPLDNVTVTAGSQESAGASFGSDGPAELAIDGNKDTAWFTAYNDWGTWRTERKGWIDIQYPEPHTVDGFRYLPAQNDHGFGNHATTQYEIWVKTTDSEDYQMVAEGNWSGSPDWQWARFDAVENVTNIKFLTTASGTNDWWAYAAEIRIMAPKEEVPEEDNLYHVTVENGTLADGSAEGDFEYNTKLTVTADKTKDGQEFAGWKAGETVLSTDREYTFFVGSDLTVTAVYEKVEIESKALLQNITVTKRDDGKSDIRFLAQLVVPEDAKLEEAGLVWRTADNKENLVIGGENVKVTKIRAISNTYQFSVTIKGVPAGKTVPGRIFAVIDGEEIYSDMIGEGVTK